MGKMLIMIKEDHYIAEHRGKPYADLSLEVVGTAWHVHFNVTRWGHNVLKENIQDLDRLKYIVKTKGGKRLVFSFNSKIGDVDKWKKYINLLKIPEPMMSYISVMEI